MRREIKDILGLLIITLPLCAGLFFYWPHSPMYKDIIADQRLAAQTYLTRTYYDADSAYNREAMIKYYGFTDDEINPSKILRQLPESPCNQNLDGVNNR